VAGGNPNIRSTGKQTRFKKGDDPRRNLNGRPPKLPEITELLDKVLGEIGPDEKSGIESMLLALHKEAKKGNVRAAEVLLNRYYGMPNQKQQVESTNKIQIVSEEDAKRLKELE
jgi:hypothetical protein